MFLIVLSHYAYHNGIVDSALPLGFNRFLLEFCELGNIGVIIFVLITGYYSVSKSNPFKLKRLLSMILQVFFYSAVIYLVFVLVGMEEFSVVGLVKNFLPISFIKYWFITAFILLYIFIPYINNLLNHLERKKHLRLIIILLAIFSILPMLTTQHFYGNELVQLVVFYIIGAYLGKYKDNYFSKKKNSWMVLAISSTILIISVIALDLLGLWMPIFGQHSNYLLSRHSIFSIAVAVSTVSLFVQAKPFTNRFINGIAACVLGVYLISDNYLVRKLIWIDILNVPGQANEPTLILHMFASVIAVFLVCTVIEFIRLHTLEKVFFVVYDKVGERFLRKRLE